MIKNDSFFNECEVKGGLEALEEFGWLNSEEPRTIPILR